MQRASSANRRWDRAKSLFTACLFSIVAFGFVDMARSTWVLNREGKRVTARVTEVPGNGPGRRPKVWYRFEVEGRPESYEHHDLFLWRTIGAPVSDEQWHAARRDRVIDVIYWPHDPRVNAPAGGPPVNDSFVCPAIGLVFASGLAALGWVLVAQSFQRARAA